MQYKKQFIMVQVLFLATCSSAFLGAMDSEEALRTVLLDDVPGLEFASSPVSEERQANGTASDMPENRLLIQANGGNTAAQYFLGSGYEERDDTDSALKYYIKASEQDHSEAQFAAGMIYYKKGKFSEAEAYFQLAADDVVAALYYLGILYHDRRDFGNALSYFQRAAENGYGKAQLRMGLAYYNEGNFEDASTYLKLASRSQELDTKSRIHVLYTLAYCLKALDRTDEALAHFKQAAEQGSAKARDYLWDYYNKEGNEIQGIAYYLSFAQQGDNRARCNLGMLYARSGETSKALFWYTRAVQAGDFLALVNLAALYESQGTYTKALKAYYLLLNHKEVNMPLRVKILGRMVCLYAEQGNLTKAQELINISVYLDMTDRFFLLSLLYKALKDPEGYKTNSHLAADTGNLQAQYNLGMIYVQEGNTQKAWYYLHLAAQRGHALAQEELRSLEGEEEGSSQGSSLQKPDSPAT